MRLIMAQVDDVSGELLGEVIQRLERLGARNVQIVSTVTKKGRPGYILYIDVPDELESDVAYLLVSELGTWGYRVLAAEHKHFDIKHIDITLVVVVGDGRYEFDLHLKSISHAGQMRVKAEHDDLSSICRILREKQQYVPLAVLKAQVESRLTDLNTTDTRVEVCLCI